MVTRAGKIMRRLGMVAGLACLVMVAQPGFADPEADYQKGYKLFLEDDLVQSIIALRAAAQGGHLKAMLMLAGLLDDAEENTEATQWYETAHKSGNSDGAVGLAQMILKNEAGARDPREAITLLTGAVEGNNPEAMLNLAHIYWDGTHGMVRDPDRALQLINQSAEVGYVPAMRELVKIYDEGLLGLEPNPEAAQSWEQQAIEASTAKK